MTVHGQRVHHPPHPIFASRTGHRTADRSSRAGGRPRTDHQALGHYGQAQAATVQALQLLPPAMRRSRAYYGAQLAETHLAQGDREQAAHTIAAFDAPSLDSRRITGRG
ncbi:hypothetical protein ADK86_19445 [Streptomyces sp. NRRL F-5755]|uniref:hypothetical protein n=1 Tax=Streptomyces sp. NRRL F-5755 TaxID=1519475 RepID=UPI0006AFDCFE|nr:hypothetical protein [Streptomyces sp. NRRL F-5755]KOT93215.1 hypothetical protein ADK86_19445 [Streptomyces sp. NRRL F-5755]